ncbi:SDR family NAD(P)-dependent oxidoreductase [Immundisolibacter sp.]|uniref:SDR family NAD(P)-dependent oxidoreductase n=1 Tax=Immundisolibacter sp. TaxID=1934948 RepID=UPI0035680CC4
MDLQLTGKLALITGSTAGIGYAIAASLAREGARVIITGRTQAGVDEALGSLRADTGVPGLGFAGDLGDAAVCEALAAAYPDVEILVNSLGIFETKPFVDIPDADWQRFFEINVMAGVRLARAYLPAMRERDWGRIVFISSESAINIPAEMVHYGMTKTAQLAVSRGLAESLAGTGITVNSVLPGPTRSRGVVEFLDKVAAEAGQPVADIEREFFNRARPSSLIRRFAEPAEIAAMVTYIVSPLASATTGAALRADGGIVRSPF